MKNIGSNKLGFPVSSTIEKNKTIYILLLIKLQYARMKVKTRLLGLKKEQIFLLRNFPRYMTEAEASSLATEVEAATQHPQTTAGILFITGNQTTPAFSCQDLNFIKSFVVYLYKHLVMQTASSSFMQSFFSLSLFCNLSEDFAKKQNLQQNLGPAALLI